MTVALPKPRQLQRKTAVAQLEIEDLRAALAEHRLSIKDAPSDEQQQRLETLLDLVGEITERLRQTLNVPVGLTVEQTAARLKVAPPTVRKWVAEGLLTPVEHRKPLELDPRSIVVVERILRRVQENYPARQWTKALAAYLHDQHVMSDDAFMRGVEDSQRGDLIEI